MARQLKGAKKATEVANTEQEKPKKNTKPQKLGGIFGKFKNTGKQSVEEDYEEELEQQQEVQVEHKPQRAKKPTDGTSYRKPEKPHSRPSAQSIASTYTQKKMQQNVFMYMTPKFFNSAQIYYNENFEDVCIVGTNSLDMLSTEFSTKTLCNAILLFVLSPNEVKPLHHFLTSIGFNNLDRRILTVFMVVREGIDVNEILDDPTISDFISVSEYIRLDKEHQFTHTTLDKAISGIIQNQPVYKDEQVKPFTPKKVTYKEPTLASLYKVDLDKLHERVESVKKELYTNKEKAKIINSMATADEKEIETAINSAPHLQIIEEVEKSLDEHLETLRKSPHMKGEVKELIENKFLLSTYKTKEVEAIVDEIVERVDVKLKAYDKSLASINKDMFKELDALKTDAKTMSKRRDEVVKELNQRYAEYKALTGLIANGHTMQSKYVATACNEICEMVKDNQSILPTETLSVISGQVKRMKLDVQEYNKERDNANERFAAAINMSNDLLKNYKIVLSYDSLIIDKLNDIIKAQDDTIASYSKYRESMFRNIGAAFINLKGSGLDTILNLIIGAKDLVVYMGDKEQGVSENVINLEEFLSTAWAPSAKQVITISNYTYDPYWRDVKNIDRVVNKLNYVSKYFNNIYIVNSLEDEHSPVDNALFTRLVKEVGSVVYSITPSLSDAASVNIIHQKLLANVSSEDIYFLAVIINKVTKEYNESLRAQMRTTMGIKARPITIPYRSDIASGVVDDNVLTTLKTLKQVIR